VHGAPAAGDQAGDLRCPFPGLRPFKEDERHLFFGRETQQINLLKRLQQSRFLAVLGTSGTGKSSLVYAGLLPALRGGYLPGERPDWHIISLTPGDAPLTTLQRELASVRRLLGPVEATELLQSTLTLVKKLRQAIAEKRWPKQSNLLVHVDQFEEVFRLPAGGRAAAWEERDAFVKLLLEASQAPDVPCFVVLTMRSEYLGDCVAFRGLPEAINEGQFLVPRMTREQWRVAIEKPVRLVGDRISPQLVQRLLNDAAALRRPAASSPARVTEDQSDELPLLQHVLRRTWHTFDRRRAAHPHAVPVMDIADYERVGTIESALSNDLDRAAADAKREVADGERLVREIFTRLRIRDSTGREVRDPVRFSELCLSIGGVAADIAAVIDLFRTRGRTFLVPEAPLPFQSDERLIDVPHECLLRRWRDLRDKWARDEDEKRRHYLRLASLAEGRQLLTGDALKDERDWWATHEPNPWWARRYELTREDAQDGDDSLPADKDDRIRVGKIADFLERSSTAEQAAAQKAYADQRRNRLYKKLIPGGIVAIAALGLVVLALVMLYQDATANANKSDYNWRRAVSYLLASKAQLAAGTVASQPDAALLALAAIRFSEAARPQGLDNVDNVSVLASSLANLARPGPQPAADTDAAAVAIDPQGALVIARQDGEIRIVAAGGAERRLQGAPNPRAIAFTARNRLLVVTHADREAAVEIWNMETGEKTATLACDTAPTGTPVVGPNDEYLFLPCGRLHRWPRANWRTGASPELVSWTKDYQPVTAVDVRADGTIAAGGEQSNGLEDDVVIQGPRGRALKLRHGTGPNIVSLLWLPDDRLAVADDSGSVRLWRLDETSIGSGQRSPDVPPPAILSAGSSVVKLAPGFSPDSFLTFSSDGTVRLWQVLSNAPVATDVFGKPVRQVALRPGSHEVVALSGGRLETWTIFDPERMHFVPSITGTPTLLGLFSGALELDSRTHGNAVIRTGRVLVADRAEPLTGDRSRQVRNVLRVFERGAAEQVWELPANLRTLSRMRLEISPDGGTYASVSADNLVVGSLSGGTLTERWRAPLPASTQSALFSTDSRTVALIKRPFLFPGVIPATRTVTFFAVDSGEQQGPFKLPPSELLHVLSNRELIVRLVDGATVIFDPMGKQEMHTLLPREASTSTARSSLAASRSGTLIATAQGAKGEASGGTALTLWKDRQSVATWRVDGQISGLRFSDDERYLAATDASGTIQIFQVGRGNAGHAPSERVRIEHRLRISASAFSPDGKYAVVLSGRMARWYSWQQADLAAELCARTSRRLSPEEWRRYIPKDFIEDTEPYRANPCPTGR
jgi:WD40 repeat protein